MTKNKLLLVLPWSPDLPGGVSVVARNLLRVWKAQGRDASILVSDWESRQAKVDSAGTLSLRLAIFGKFTIVGLIKALILSPILLWRTRALLNKQLIGTVFFHYVNLNSFGVALLKRLGFFRGRLVLCFHGTDVRKPSHWIEKVLWDFVLNSASEITACSDSLARAVEENFGLVCGSVVTVYNGVNAQLFSPTSHSKNTAKDFFGENVQHYIVSVGSFIERKGHKSLLEAFVRVATALPKVGLVVIGMDGDQRWLLEKQVIDLGLEKSVRLLVNLKPQQVANAVAGATLCVQPSIAEPFGMAVTEAGASGVCVAASAVGGHLELISHEKTGFLFEASNVTEMQNLIVEILQDDARRARVANAFQTKIRSTFTWEACADHYHNVGQDELESEDRVRAF